MGMGSTPIPLTLQLTYDVLTTEWATTEDLAVRLPMYTKEVEIKLCWLVVSGVAEQKLEDPCPGRIPRVLWRRTDWATQQGG